MTLRTTDIIAGSHTRLRYPDDIPVTIARGLLQEWSTGTTRRLGFPFHGLNRPPIPAVDWPRVCTEAAYGIFSFAAACTRGVRRDAGSETHAGAGRPAAGTGRLVVSARSQCAGR